ncbi:YitT family protein [Neobacillus sp. YX16]|uniref:YitT family protein n=1 Tax=Neobacillus sp. YX16 TaxID=3047874 RepID=UPI0024C26E64|nr:YitT family protein [Neobacillus sp. YX16]WHZ02990.1 YitT family protein [Neobacillus sp. YX16]
MWKTIKECLYILFGGLIFSVGINYFTIPNLLSEGGIIGLTVIAHYLFDLSPGMVNFVLNTVLVLIGYKFLEKRSIIYTLFSIFSCSLFMYITEETGKRITDDPLLASIFAGLLVGGGLGIIFRAGGTSGGTTIVAKLANQFLGWSMGKGILLIDIIVVAGSVFIIGLVKAMYTLIAVYIGAKVIDFIVDGLEEKVAVFIISNSPQLVLHRVTNKMSRGITVLEGRGGYTGDNKEVLYIVISRQEVVRLKNMISEIDEQAYVTVHHVQEVIGKGYKAS